MATTVPSLNDSFASDSSSHRRITLQSPSDLTYLRATALAAARAKIDLHLPLEAALRDASSGLTTDDLRKKVEEEVAAYVERVFADVRHGVEVNGLVYEEGADTAGQTPAPAQYEAYDAQLAGRLQGLHARIEELDTEMARLRAEAVGAAAVAWQEEYAQAAKADAQAGEPAWVAGHEAPLLGDEGVRWQGRSEDVRGAWEGATQGLVGLQGKMEATRQKAERAVEVGQFLEKGTGTTGKEES
ncbi:hypothetical protein FH972_022899 [Carpinus fangiana]|uniref:Uncharacterized protein n=1 Tax=Carpinus fangiana TaxID=176857 RepID=A0A5N6KTW6_9ROSI|nr:hypothetical protein FH972_022899 [Carpinus fangiana]